MSEIKFVAIFMFVCIVSLASAETHKDPQMRLAFNVPTGTPMPGEMRASSLPDHAPPQGLQSIDELSGGRILSGRLTDVASGEATFKAGLRRTRGYFDSSPKLLSVVRSKDGAITLSTFTALLRHTAVNGLAIASYDPAGNSRFSALLDTPERFTKSLPAMLHHVHTITEDSLERERPSGGDATMDFARFEAASKHVALNRTSFPDGTASIGVAHGFTPKTMNGGSFFATAEDGAYIKIFMPFMMLDPNGSLYKQMARLSRNSGGSPNIPGQIVVPYDSNPVNAWKRYLTENSQQQSVPNPSPQIIRSDSLPGMTNGWTGRNVSGTLTLNGRKIVFTGTMLASPPPGPNGGWMLSVTILGAPAESASTDMPAMMAMRKSEKVDLQAVRNQTMRNIDKINAESSRWLAANKAAGDAASRDRFERSMANARAARDSMDRSTAGFIHHINDTTVLQHNPSGAHATIDANLASALERSDPEHFSVVQVKDYIKGRDY